MAAAVRVRSVAPMKRLTLPTALLAVLLGALALSACGFGSGGAPPGPSLTTRWHLVAQCVRNHGYPNFPDPTVGSDGKPQLPPGVTPPPTVPPACQSLLDQATAASQAAGGQGSHQPTHDVAKLRQFAACMRANGLDDWPDPDSQGRFALPPDLEGKGGPRWGAISVAWNGPCAQYDPGGSIDTVPAP